MLACFGCILLFEMRFSIFIFFINFLIDFFSVYGLIFFLLVKFVIILEQEKLVLLLDVGPSMHSVLPEVEKVCSMLVEKKVLLSINLLKTLSFFFCQIF